MVIMRELDFINTIERLKDTGFSPCPDIVRISVPNAKEVLMRGLEHFLGKENVKWLPEYEHVTQWLSDNKGRGLLLVGDCGRGKSLICRKILPIVINYYFKKNVTVYDATDLNKKSMTNEILSSHLTCLDDLGTENELNDFGTKRIVFCELADLAEKQGKILLLTTNLSEEELRQKYGERTIDRLHAITRKIVFRGNSLRR